MLKLSELRQVSFEFAWTFTSPVRGVALIDGALGLAGVGLAAPLHWRVGLWDKPPCDFAIDEKSGSLLSVQIVAQDERIPSGPHPQIAGELVGLPCFPTEEWRAGRYSDERRPVRIWWAGLAVLVVHWGDERDGVIARRVPLGKRASLLFSSDDSLVGVLVEHVLSDERAVLELAGS